MLIQAGFECTPLGLDSSTGRVVDQYPEGASSNPTEVNIFQLTFCTCTSLRMILK